MSMPHRSIRLAGFGMILALAVMAEAVHAVAVTPAAMADARGFVAAKIAGEAAAPESASLEVLDNHDPVQLNARGGKPLRLDGKPYTAGLYCHAHSRIVVHMPAAANSSRPSWAWTARATRAGGAA